MTRRDAIRAVLAMPAVSSIRLPQRVVQNIREQVSDIWPNRKIVVLDGELRLRIARAHA